MTHRRVSRAAVARSRVIGEVLREVRHDARMSLEGVEYLSGGEVKASILGAYERAERVVTVERLRQLAAIYQVPIVVLVSVIEKRMGR